MTGINHRILLRARPTGIPAADNFIADSVPVRPPGEDEVMLETIFLSIDPAMRSWMTEAVAVGEVMRSGGIARVLESRSGAFRPGELV
jgi:NADPH-dependent curcumin reductase CurA